jgi:1-aminocyclopropane-1-carboxylate deaminase
LRDIGTRQEEAVIGFSALKGNLLRKEIETLLATNAAGPYPNWQLIADYHFGGYARYRN